MSDCLFNDHKLSNTSEVREMSFDDLMAKSLFQPVARIARPDIPFGTLRREHDAIGYITNAHCYYTAFIRFSAKSPHFADCSKDPEW